jgi:hypothetical protein
VIAMSSLQDNRRALDRWARATGWADFDTYVRLGGSIGDAARDIAGRVLWLNRATAALHSYTPPPEPKRPEPPQPELHREEEDYERASGRLTIGPEALARLEAEAAGDPHAVDASDLQAQGFDDASS